MDEWMNRVDVMYGFIKGLMDQCFRRHMRVLKEWSRGCDRVVKKWVIFVKE